MYLLRAHCTLMFQLSTFTFMFGYKQNLVMLLTSTLPKSQLTTVPSSFLTLFLGLQVIPEARMLTIPRLQAVTYLSSILVMHITQQKNLQGSEYSANVASGILEMGKKEVAPQQANANTNTPTSLMVGAKVLGMLTQSPVRLRQFSKSVYSQTGPTRQAGRKFTYPRQVMQLGFQTTLRQIWSGLRLQVGLAPFWQLQASPIQLNSCIMKMPVMSKGFSPQLMQRRYTCSRERAKKHSTITMCPTYFLGENTTSKQTSCCCAQRIHFSLGKRQDWKAMVRAMVRLRKRYLLQMRERRQLSGIVTNMIKIRSAWSGGRIPRRGFCNIKTINNYLRLNYLQLLQRMIIILALQTQIKNSLSKDPQGLSSYPESSIVVH